MKRDKVSTLRIIGAGPGDPELLTIKAVLALQKAEVVLYDALINVDVLHHYTSSDCKRVYVGKRKGKKEFSQEEINELIVFYGKKFENVVRLKGGDPFVFGRGHEEIAYAHEHGMHVEVIPGISSAIAAPCAAGIPVTKRGVSQSLWIVTGTQANGELGDDVYQAARSSATVVVLMGITKLKTIASIFKDARGEDEPVAVIQHATCDDQNFVAATVADIDQAVIQNGIGSPAVIVIGKVVNESLLLKDIAQNLASVRS